MGKPWEVEDVSGTLRQHGSVLKTRKSTSNRYQVCNTAFFKIKSFVLRCTVLHPCTMLSGDKRNPGGAMRHPLDLT